MALVISDDSARTHSLTLNLPIVLLPATTYLEPSLSVRNGPWHSLECERVSGEAMACTAGVSSVHTRDATADTAGIPSVSSAELRVSEEVLGDAAGILSVHSACSLSAITLEF